jgi:hypothetical protein
MVIDQERKIHADVRSKPADAQHFDATSFGFSTTEFSRQCVIYFVFQNLEPKGSVLIYQRGNIYCSRHTCRVPDTKIGFLRCFFSHGPWMMQKWAVAPDDVECGTSFSHQGKSARYRLFPYAP